MLVSLIPQILLKLKFAILCVSVLQSPLKSPNWDAIIQQYGDMDKWNTPAILKGPNIFDFVTPGTPRSATITTFILSNVRIIYASLRV